MMSAMSTPATVNTRHSLTGKIQRVTVRQQEVFADYLEIVPDDAKPLEPGMFKPGKVGEFKPPKEDKKADEKPAESEKKDA